MLVWKFFTDIGRHISFWCWQWSIWGAWCERSKSIRGELPTFSQPVHFCRQHWFLFDNVDAYTCHICRWKCRCTLNIWHICRWKCSWPGLSILTVPMFPKTTIQWTQVSLSIFGRFMKFLNWRYKIMIRPCRMYRVILRIFWRFILMLFFNVSFWRYISFWHCILNLRWTVYIYSVQS